MAGFPTVDSIINALSVNLLGQELHFVKQLAGSPAIGAPHTVWSATGNPIAGGNTTSGKANGAVCTSATAGALPYTNPTAPATMHLLSLGALIGLNLNPGTLILVDRVAHVQLAHNEATGSITGMSATSRLGATTGYGDGCQIWCEVTSAFSAASNTITYSYTNQVGTGSKVTASVVTVASRGAGKSINGNLWQPLASGDRAVRSIESVTLSSGTATGSYNLCLVKPLARLNMMGGGIMVDRDCVLEMPRLPRIYDSSCLHWIYIPNTNGTQLIQGSCMVAEN